MMVYIFYIAGYPSVFISLAVIKELWGYSLVFLLFRNNSHKSLMLVDVPIFGKSVLHCLLFTVVIFFLLISAKKKKMMSSDV